MFLYRSFDGTYGTMTSYWNNDFVFATPESMTRHEVYPSRDVTLLDLREEVTTLAGTTPHPPTYDMPFLPAPILIQTAENSLYLLPVDRDEPELLAENVQHVFIGQQKIAIATENDFFIYLRHDHSMFREREDGAALPFLPIPDFSRCEQITCFEFSPIHNFIAFILDENTIRLCASMLNCDNPEFGGHNLDGQAFSFSPNGEMMAVWNQDHISIYRIRGEWQMFIPPTEPLIEISADLNAEQILGHGAWSPDSSWFAYSDSDGLWSRDLLLLETESMLLIPTDDRGIPLATDYSDQGRYIFVTHGEDQFIYDTRTKTMLADAEISPDDRILTTIDDIVLMENGKPKVVWLDHRTLIYMQYSNYNKRYSLVTAAGNNDYFFPIDTFISHEKEQLQRGLNFDYELLSGAILVQNDGTHLSVGTHSIDLMPYLDSDIISVEWLPAVFFQE